MATDPYTLVYNTLWAALEGHSDFTDLVPIKNRIRFTGDDRSPIKAKLASADTPDVRIVMQQVVMRETGASGGTEADRVRFTVELATGDQRLDARAFPITWAIRQAIYGADAALRAIEFNSKTGWVLNPHTGTIDFGIAQDAEARGLIGWAAVCAVEMQLWFSKIDLTP